VTSQSEGSLITAAQLLGCDKDELRKSLVSRAMQATKGGRAGTVIQYDVVYLWCNVESLLLRSR